MKVQVVIRLAFLILLTVALLTLITPLAFTNVWIRNVAYLITIVLSFLVARQVKRRFLRSVIAGVPFFVFAFLTFSTFIFSFADRVSDDWRTAWISHRQKNHKNIYIGEQMLDVGALGYDRRTVRVIPVTLLFRWVTKADTSGLGNNWIRVNEHYNPYGLKY